MNQTETVRYALKETRFKEISRGKGAIEYHLIDEHGNKRTVPAMATLGWGNRIRSVRPIHHRETPLVEALAKASINETIAVNFSEFNKKYPRGSVRSKKVAIQHAKTSFKDAQFINSIGSLADHKIRFVRLLAISLVSFAVIMMLVHSFNL